MDKNSIKILDNIIVIKYNIIRIYFGENKNGY